MEKEDGYPSRKKQPRVIARYLKPMERIEYRSLSDAKSFRALEIIDEFEDYPRDADIRCGNNDLEERSFIACGVLVEYRKIGIEIIRRYCGKLADFET